MTIDSACEGTRVILPSLVATAPLNNFSVAVKPPIEAFQRSVQKPSSPRPALPRSPGRAPAPAVDASRRRLEPHATRRLPARGWRRWPSSRPRESSPRHAWGQGAGGFNSATNERRRRARGEGEIRDAPRSLPGRKREGTRLDRFWGKVSSEDAVAGMRSVSRVTPVCNTPNVQAGQNLSRMRRDSGIGLNNALFRLQRLLVRHPHSLPRSDERTEEHRALRRRRREGQRASAGRARRR